MFENIVLAVDGSPYSRRALPLAVDIAKKSDGEIVVLHVREHLWADIEGTWELESKNKADELVEGFRREIEAAGCKVKTDIRRGLVGRLPQIILDATDEHEADLLVMGSRGLSGLAGLLLGSVTNKVLQLSDHRAVLVAR